MEEKGLGIYAYFKTKGITLTPKELADVMNNIAVRKNRNVILKNTEKDVDEICSEIGLHPSAIKKWLEFLSVPQELANALHNIFFFQQNENYSVEQRSFAKRRGLQLLRLTSSRMPTPTTRFTVKKVPLRGGKDEPFLRETFGQKALKSNKNETKIRL